MKSNVVRNRTRFNRDGGAGKARDGIVFGCKLSFEAIAF